MASGIYGKPESQISKEERFMGKQAVLSCGYGVGPGGFQRMLKMFHDIDIPEEEAKAVVMAYRRAHTRVVDYWKLLDTNAKLCIREQWGTWHSVGRGLAMRCFKNWFCIKLPSKRILWYYSPSLVDTEMGLSIMYYGRDQNRGGAWARIKTYGGKLCENITQAIARDILGESVIRLETAGLPVLLLVHDSILAEDNGSWSLEEFTAYVKAEPSFWSDIPLDVDAHKSFRYGKS